MRCLVVLFMLLVVLSVGFSSANDWPMFHNNPENTGYNSGTGPLSNETLWNYTTGGAVRSSPAVVDGVAYVGSDDGKVYALDASTGDVIWSYATGGKVYSSPAVVDGVVYVGSYDNNTYALYASNGTLLWNYTTGGAVYSSPTISGGVVYVSSNDGYVYALNASTGDLIWNYDTGATMGISSAPAVSGNVVYIHPCETVDIHAVYANNGSLIQKYVLTSKAIASSASSPPIVCSSPAVAGEMVYVGAYNGYVYALNTTAGSVSWSYYPGEGVYSSPAVVDGVVYVGSNNNNTYALDAGNGSLIWSYTTGSYVSSSPAVVNGVVYIGSEDGKVYALNTSDGTLVWSYSTGDWVISSPAVVDGVAYFGSGDSKVYAVGTLSGTSSDTQAPQASQVYPTTATWKEVTSFRVNATDDTGVTGCTFYWDGSGVGAMTLVSGNSTNGTWEYNYTPSDGGTFSVWGNCTDGSGNWNYTNTSVTVSCASIPAVDASMSEVTNSSVSLEVTVGSDVASYTIYINDSQCTSVTNPKVGTAYVSCSGLTPDTLYEYNVTMCNGCGECNSSSGTFRTALEYLSQTVNANETLNITGQIIVNFTASGTASVAQYSGNPWGLTLPATGVKYFDVSNAGGGGAVITLYYADAELSAVGVDEDTLKVYHWTGSAWEDVTVPGSLNTSGNSIQANVTSLSPILLGGTSGGGGTAATTVVSAPGYDLVLVAFLFALALFTICCGRNNKTI